MDLTRRDRVVYTPIKKHILTDCADFIGVRKRYYRCTKIKDIFDVVDPHRVLDFLRELQLYKII